MYCILLKVHFVLILLFTSPSNLLRVVDTFRRICCVRSCRFVTTYFVFTISTFSPGYRWPWFPLHLSQWFPSSVRPFWLWSSSSRQHEFRSDPHRPHGLLRLGKRLQRWLHRRGASPENPSDVREHDQCWMLPHCAWCLAMPRPGGEGLFWHEPGSLVRRFPVIQSGEPYHFPSQKGNYPFPFHKRSMCMHDASWYQSHIPLKYSSGA